MARGTLTNATIDPRAEDTEIVQAVYDWFRSARAARAPMVRTWNRCYKTLRAQTPESSNGGPNIRIPELFRLVRSSVGWKLDQRILTEVSPMAPLGSEWYSFLNERCRDMEVVLEASHWANHEEIENEKMLWNADTYGTGILKTTWDDNLAGGIGDAHVTSVNPYCLYVDPAATNFDNADYIIEARAMSIQELDRRWPGKGKLFVNGDIGESIDEPPNQLSTPSSTVPRPSVIGRPTPGRVSASNTPLWSTTTTSDPFKNHQSDPVVVIECWVREHTIASGQVSDGWRVIVVAGNHLLMNEKASDLTNHGNHPYDRYVPHDLGEFWGIGLVELLGPVQSALNRILRSVQQNVELTGNPIMLEDYGAMTQQSALSSARPGARLSKRSQKEVRWLEPPSLHPNIGELIQFLLDRMQAVSGLNDLPNGGVQGRPAAETAGMLVESQFVAIRSQLINLEHTLQGAYRKKVALIAENYTEPRWVSITGPDGTETPKMLSARHFMRPTPDGGVPLEYNIKVDAGSAAHTSRKVREDRAVTLFTLGALDNLSLLEMLDIPNPQAIMERLKLQQQSILAANPPGQRQRARA